ncbi:hypothetical protein WJX72_002651 [[Myrmecia] bisecta]|uniref:C3H1-type domain-containing protein n=1 Tax=[Myrmecia] bisecta TaxID=41462 RepID=A0AAW1P554_9CHLO
MDGSRVCRFFRQRGNCKFGDYCKFSHDLEGSVARQYAERVWSHHQASTSSGPAPDWSFRCCTYNCLADELATAHVAELYRAVPRWALEWRARFDGLLREIQHWQPDLLCLQEVDHPEDFAQALEGLGYEWRYAQRTGGRQDGCATFWRSSKFSLIGEEVIHMSSLNLRDNVAQLVLLRPVDCGEPGRGKNSPSASEGVAFLVANTHVLFNPKRGDIKLAQLRTTLLRMDAICQERGGPTLRLFMGDFNATPWSSLYRFLAEGRLDLAVEDRRNMSGQTEGRGWPPKWLKKCMPSAPQPVPRRVAMRADDPSFGSASQPLEPHMLATSQSTVNLKDVELNSTPQRVLHNSVTLRAAALESVARSPLNSATSHGSSWPCGLSSMQAMRRASQSPGQQLYCCVDAVTGQSFMSPLPPVQGCAKPRVPFFYNAMITAPADVLLSPRGSPHHPRQYPLKDWRLEELQMCGATLQPAPSLNGYVDSHKEEKTWVVEQPQAMSSAYAEVGGSEPNYTSCHGRFIGTVDYIWYHSQASSYVLEPLRVLDPPPLETLHCGLPSPEWASDHICLVCEFGLRNNILLRADTV